MSVIQLRRALRSKRANRWFRFLRRWYRAWRLWRILWWRYTKRWWRLYQRHRRKLGVRIRWEPTLHAPLIPLWETQFQRLRTDETKTKRSQPDGWALEVKVVKLVVDIWWTKSPTKPDRFLAWTTSAAFVVWLLRWWLTR